MVFYNSVGYYYLLGVNISPIPGLFSFDFYSFSCIEQGKVSTGQTDRNKLNIMLDESSLQLIPTTSNYSESRADSIKKIPMSNQKDKTTKYLGALWI